MTPRIDRLALSLALACSLGLAAPALANENDGGHYEVTITNLTRGQQFTPLLAVTHKPNVKLFELGRPASPELAILAEEGNTAPLAAALAAQAGAGHVVAGSGLTQPGASVTLTVEARAGFRHLSLAAMLIPTNDAFVAINGVPLPPGNESLSMTALAYDAGSERNDELCASIPGPMFIECGGSGGGGAPAGGEEGYVHIHAGMHGIGNFAAAARDWRNPVALITVRRIR